MSGFQEQLDDEIKKRGLNSDEEKHTSSLSSDAQKTFSMNSFIRGLVLCAAFFVALIIWAYFKAGDTQAMIDGKLASKTAVVKQSGDNAFHLGDSQPVLRMPPVEAENEMTAQEPVKKEASDVAQLIEKYNGDGSLVPAPVPGLYESTGDGLLPTPRKEDGLIPFEAYKRPYNKNSERPIISFVINDLGISRNKTEKIIDDFPADVTLAFSPYARDLKLLTDVARKAGHEVWLNLPMETKNYPLNDPGPSTLLVNASVEQNKSRLTSILAATQGYVGFVSGKDHVFRREDADVNPSVQEIFGRGLAILDSNTSVSSFVGGLASKHDYPHAKNNFWLDEDLTPIALNQKIRKMMEFADGYGHVIVMLQPYPASLNVVKKFLDSKASKKYQIAPVSAQVKYGE